MVGRPLPFQSIALVHPGAPSIRCLVQHFQGDAKTMTYMPPSQSRTPILISKLAAPHQPSKNGRYLHH